MGDVGEADDDGLDRGSGWEFLLFADELESGMANLASKRRDFDFGYAPPSTVGPSLPGAFDALTFLSDYMEKIVTGVQGLARITDPANVERTFGPPGQAGDREAIRHYASVILRFYEYLLDWAATLRAATGPEEIRLLCQKVAVLAERPLNEISEFVASSIATMREVVGAVRSGAQAKGDINLFIALSLDETLLDEAMEYMSHLADGDLGASEARNDELATLRKVTSELATGTTDLRELRNPWDGPA